MEGTGKIFGLWEVRVLPRSLAYVRFFLTLAQPVCSLPFYHRQVDTGHSLSPESVHEPQGPSGLGMSQLILRVRRGHGPRVRPWALGEAVATGWGVGTRQGCEYWVSI